VQVPVISSRGLPEQGDNDLHASCSIDGHSFSNFEIHLDQQADALCAGTLSEASAQAWPELALACGRVGEAMEAVKLGTASHPQSAALCSQAITFAAEVALQVPPTHRPSHPLYVAACTR